MLLCTALSSQRPPHQQQAVFHWHCSYIWQYIVNIIIHKHKIGEFSFNDLMLRVVGSTWSVTHDVASHHCSRRDCTVLARTGFCRGPGVGAQLRADHQSDQCRDNTGTTQWAVTRCGVSLRSQMNRGLQWWPCWRQRRAWPACPAWATDTSPRSTSHICQQVWVDFRWRMMKRAFMTFVSRFVTWSNTCNYCVYLWPDTLSDTFHCATCHFTNIDCHAVINRHICNGVMTSTTIVLDCPRWKYTWSLHNSSSHLQSNLSTWDQTSAIYRVRQITSSPFFNNA